MAKLTRSSCFFPSNFWPHSLRKLRPGVRAKRLKGKKQTKTAGDAFPTFGEKGSGFAALFSFKEGPARHQLK